MKKLLALFLAIGMLFSIASVFADDVVLDERGAVENPEVIVAGENELIFWSLFSGGEGGYMESIVEAYNATNPEMTVRNVMLDWGEYYTKLMTSVSVGKGPDIGISHIAKLPELYDQGVIMAMDEAGESMDMDWSQFNQTTLAAATIDGNIYSVPIDTHAEVFFYNRDILEEAGIIEKDQDLLLPNDAEEFYQLMLGMKEKLPDGIYPLSFSTSGDDPYRLWWALYFQQDAPAILTSDLEITLDKDKTVNALNYMKKFYDDGIIPLNLEDFYGYFMNARQAATFISGVWCTSSLENIDDFRFGVTSIPVVYDTNAQWGDSHTFILPTKPKADPKRMEEAMKFFDFMSRNGSVTWAKAGHVVANINVLESEEFAELPYRSDYADVANHVVFYEPTPFSYPVRDALVRQIDAFLAGNQDADATFDAIIDEIEAIIF